MSNTTERALRVHELKTDPEVFDAVARGEKTHEIRFNDRGFRVGDTLRLVRTQYTGAEMREGKPLRFTPVGTLERTVSHVLTGYGLMDGWCILSFAATPAQPVEPAIKFVPVDKTLRNEHWRHPNDDEPRTPECRAALKERGDDEGQGLDGYWKWGFAAGFNAALAASQPVEPANGALMEAVNTLLDEAPCDCPHGMRFDRGEHFAHCYLFDLNIAALAASQPVEPAEREPEGLGGEEMGVAEQYLHEHIAREMAPAYAALARGNEGRKG